MRALRVLVVEDGEETSSLVRDMGHVPMHVGTSASAHRKTAVWNPDLVLVDLTRFDGVKLARQLRSDSRIPKMPLIGITAFMDVGQRHTAIDAGFDEFLAMPYKPSELAGILLRVESRIAESKAIAERTCAIAELSRERNSKSRQGLDGQPGAWFSDAMQAGANGLITPLVEQELATMMNPWPALGDYPFEEGAVHVESCLPRGDDNGMPLASAWRLPRVD